jgi:hypothetical protein
VQLVAGRDHVLALDTLGQVYSWGRNDHGQLGHGEKEEVAETKMNEQNLRVNNIITQRILTKEKPKRIEGQLKSKQICKIFAGENTSFAVTKEGEVFGWGDNTYG